MGDLLESAFPFLLIQKKNVYFSALIMQIIDGEEENE